MRHRKSFNHLGRKVGHRDSMLANMASSLILHKRIKTTTAKAKALRVFVEPLITKSKNDSTHSRRVVFSYLQDKDAVSELFREVSQKVTDRPGGYTRILKTGTRLGDKAEMCIIELVDYNENLLKAKDESMKTGRRRRRGGKKKTEGLTPEVASPEAAEEAVVEEATSEEEVKASAEQEITQQKEAAVSEEQDKEATITEPDAEADEELIKTEEAEVEEDKVETAKDEVKAEENEEEKTEAEEVKTEAETAEAKKEEDKPEDKEETGKDEGSDKKKDE